MFGIAPDILAEANQCTYFAPVTVLPAPDLLMQERRGAGISPGSANQCILGDVYLRSNLSRKGEVLICHIWRKAAF